MGRETENGKRKTRKAPASALSFPDSRFPFYDLSVSFRRALGPFDATMVVVGGIIGAGIFINPHVVAERLASSALVLAAWIVGGVIALAGAFAFAELAALFPR